MSVLRDMLPSKIDLSFSRLKPFQGFIFLCGGPTDAKSHKPISLRDALHRELVKHDAIEPRIRLAEDYQDWGQASLYHDLVSFESHLAELSSVIVLVLESAGSIAELGLFSVIEEFQQKLLIFVDTGHYEEKSFIRLGPIDFLEKIHGNLANCHRWYSSEYGIKKFDADAASSLQAELAEAVINRATESPKEHKFAKEKWLHGALLVSDLLNLTAALTLREIRSLLSELGCEKAEHDIKQILYLLERVGFLVMEAKGEQRFYVSRREELFIKLHLMDNTFDLHRFQSDLLSEYSISDKKRFRAIQEVRKRA